MISLSGLANLRLFFFPCQIFRFLTMVRASRIPIRAAFAGGITVVTDGLGHCRPPFLMIPPGHGLTRRRGLCLLSALIEVTVRDIRWQSRAYASRWSSIPDLNRRYLLGRQVCYHYTNAAYNRRAVRCPAGGSFPAVKINARRLCSRWRRMTESNRPPGRG